MVAPPFTVLLLSFSFFPSAFCNPFHFIPLKLVFLRGAFGLDLAAPPVLDQKYLMRNCFAPFLCCPLHLLGAGDGRLDLHFPVCCVGSVRQASRAQVNSSPILVHLDGPAHSKAQLYDSEVPRDYASTLFGMVSFGLSSYYRAGLFVFLALPFASLCSFGLGALFWSVGFKVALACFSLWDVWVFIFYTLVVKVLFGSGYCFVCLVSACFYLGFSGLIFCSLSLLVGGGSLWVTYDCAISIDFWSSGCLPFTRHFLISIPFYAIILTCISVGLWKRWLFCVLVFWFCFSISCSFHTIAGGDSFVAVVNHSLESDTRNFGCLPFSRGFGCLVHPCLVSLACDYMVWMEKWCLCFRSTSSVSVCYVIITWASDTSLDSRAIRNFLFVYATVVLAFTLGMRVCFELVTMGVLYMVVDLLSLVSRLEFIFLMDLISLTFHGLSPLLRWHLCFVITLRRRCISRVTYASSCFSILFVLFCISFFGFGWSNPNIL